MVSSKLSDYIDIDLLQSIQDKCSRAMGVALVAVDFRGVPVTAYSGFTRHCDLMRSKPETRALCEQCDAHGGLRGAMTNSPCCYRCHAGLVDFAIPFVFNGVYLGAMLGGQVSIDDDGDIENILPAAAYTDTPALKEARGQAPRFDRARLQAIMDTVHDLVLFALRTSEDRKASKELLHAREEAVALRCGYEEAVRALRHATEGGRRREEAMRHFYFFMNTIRMLASEEGAGKTEQVTLDYTDVLRYFVDTKSPITTLGEEADFVRALLRVLKTWYGASFDFEVSVPVSLRSTPCPFMAFLPMIDLGIAGIGEKPGQEREVVLVATGRGPGVSVIFATDGCDVETAREALEDQDSSRVFSLFSVNSALREFVGAGEGPGIAVGERPGGRKGTELSFTLPVEQV